jgi:fructose-1,6-bisphosphatase II
MGGMLPERSLTGEVVAVTETAAIAAAHWMGSGDGRTADQAAVEAMRRALDEVSFRGRIVIGEGERDEAPMLYIGEEVGGGGELEVDIAVDPLEGTNLVAKGLANATAVLAAAEPGGLLHAPDTYMEKLIVGKPAKGRVDLDRPVTENLQIIAASLDREVADLTVVVLDRPRHEKLIAAIRSAGARIKLISDGDLTAAISVVVAGTGVHAVMGTGGAPEGVLAAAALRCVGGEILGRLRFRSDEERARAKRMGIDKEDRVYRTEDLASAKRLAFVATGVTDGELLKGVRFFGGAVRTHSIVMQLSQGKIRFVDTIHIIQRDRVPVIRLQ